MKALRLALCLLATALSAPALAVMSGYEPPPEAAGDPDYAAGMAAFEQSDWQGVVDNLVKVVERRPWDDNAHTLLGYAHRKLGDYRRSLKHYRRALELNPYHRGALEYLGEAYLEVGQPARATEMLDRLEAECRRIATDASEDGWKSDCQEWQDLAAAIDAYRKRAARYDAGR